MLAIKGARHAHAAIRASGRVPGEEGREVIARNRERKRREWEELQRTGIVPRGSTFHLRRAACHPAYKHYAKGLCKPCYEARRRASGGMRSMPGPGGEPGRQLVPPSDYREAYQEPARYSLGDAWRRKGTTNLDGI